MASKGSPLEVHGSISGTGDNQLEWNDSFMLYMTTKLSNPKYTPEASPIAWNQAKVFRCSVFREAPVPSWQAHVTLRPFWGTVGIANRNGTSDRNGTGDLQKGLWLLKQISWSGHGQSLHCELCHYPGWPGSAAWRANRLLPYAQSASAVKGSC